MVHTYLAISGSLRKGSRNTALLHSVVTLNRSDAIRVEEFDISNIPLYNQDLEVGDDRVKEFPTEVSKLHEAVSKARGLILVSPEHNYLMSAAMKNVIDWLSRGTVLNGKVVALMSAGGSSGGSSATSSMKTILEKLTWLNITVISREVNVKLFDGEQKFNEQDVLIHEPTISDINAVFSEIIQKS